MGGLGELRIKNEELKMNFFAWWGSKVEELKMKNGGTYCFAEIGKLVKTLFSWIKNSQLIKLFWQIP